MDDERPPICPTCGVTMVPVSLSAWQERAGEWICLECEETGELEMTEGLRPASIGETDDLHAGD